MTILFLGDIVGTPGLATKRGHCSKSRMSPFPARCPLFLLEDRTAPAWLLMGPGPQTGSPFGGDVSGAVNALAMDGNQLVLGSRGGGAFLSSPLNAPVTWTALEEKKGSA